jgi:hypothetical protein
MSLTTIWKCSTRVVTGGFQYDLGDALAGGLGDLDFPNALRILWYEELRPWIIESRGLSCFLHSLNNTRAYDLPLNAADCCFAKPQTQRENILFTFLSLVAMILP